MKRVLTALAATMLMASTTSAQAGSYTFSFSAPSSTNPADILNLSGTFTTANTLNQFGGYDITSITGTLNGQTILGLDPNTYTLPQFKPYYSNADFVYDNTLLTNDPYSANGLNMDEAGLSFHTATTDVNLGNNVGSQSYAFLTPNGSGGSLNSIQSYFGTLHIASATPEPAAWALMVLGIGFVGAALRRQRRAEMMFGRIATAP